MLAAAALGEYVEKYRQNLQVQRMVAVDVSKRMSEMSFDEEKLGKAIAQAMSDPNVLAMLSQEPEGERAA